MTNTIPPDLKPLQPYYPEPETDLVDVWLVLRRRRNVFFGAVLIAFLLAAALIQWMSPVYESRVVVQVGHLNGNIPVEPAAVMVERLTEQYSIKDGTEGPRPLPQLVSIKVNKGVQDVVTLTARAHTPDEAQRYLGSVVASLQTEHDSVYQEAVLQQRNRAEQIARRIAQLQQHQQTLGDNAVSKSIDATQRALLLQDRSKVLQEIRMFDQELSALQTGLSKIQTLPTRLLRDPTLPVKPLQPRPLLYLALALAGGMMLGIIGVFLVEYLVQARQRLRTSVDV